MHVFDEYSARVWTSTRVFNNLPGVCYYYQAVILVWILIMCGGGKIRQSFEVTCKPLKPKFDMHGGVYELILKHTRPYLANQPMMSQMKRMKWDIK